MKKIFPFFGVSLLFFLLAFDYEPYYNPHKPIFMLREEMEANVKIVSPRELENPGKIYLKDNFIFINEKYRGIHVIDNTNPENPVNIKFIQIDGCIDMSIKGNVLYADNAVDLIAIRLNENVENIEVTKRIRNVFPEFISPEGYQLTWKEEQAKPENAILVRWDLR